MSATIQTQSPVSAEQPIEALTRPPASRLLEGMSGPRKAAILCISLGDEVASNMLRHLGEDEVQAVSRELAALQQVPPRVSMEVIEEFYQLMLARSYVSAGGVEYAERLLYKAYGPEVAKRLLGRITRSLESSAGFEALQKVDPQQLLKMFQTEHPQTIALVLAHMTSTMAADMLSHMPEAQRSDIVLRMANLESISQDVIRRVSIVLDQKLRSIADLTQQSVGGVSAVAEMCNRLDRESVRRILEDIETTSPEIALEIRNLMVTFDDILLVDDVGMREVLQRVDKKILSLALKGTVPEVQDRFFTNMSGRAVEMLKEEMDFMGQVRMKDVSGAQREIVEVMRKLDEAGVINISNKESGKDLYVS